VKCTIKRNKYEEEYEEASSVEKVCVCVCDCLLREMEKQSTRICLASFLFLVYQVEKKNISFCRRRFISIAFF